MKRRNLSDLLLSPALWTKRVFRRRHVRVERRRLAEHPAGRFLAKVWSIQPTCCRHSSSPHSSATRQKSALRRFRSASESIRQRELLTPKMVRHGQDPDQLVSALGDSFPKSMQHFIQREKLPDSHEAHMASLPAATGMALASLIAAFPASFAASSSGAIISLIAAAWDRTSACSAADAETLSSSSAAFTAV